ncbi:MAG TPA: divergent polysaccharide deacetylase family protein [Candidatus Syntrophosphaera sp.]|nr:divergent polysaccharide deacetylase family protein [Candidatus Syntrophosphaera sp.]
MPRKTKRRKKRKTGKQDHFPLGLWLLVGFLCAGIVWLISIRPESLSEKPQEVETAQSSAEPDQVVEQAAKKLGIPQPKIKKDTAKKEYSLPIDRGKMDLTFANMIVKNEFESKGAKQTSGKAAANKQTLTFKAGKKNAEVNLYYDKKEPKSAATPKYIAIVVDDFGSVKGDLLQGFLDLPREVTFAIFPDLDNSVSTMELAKAQGRETLVHVPMEPIDYPVVNPGKDPILVDMSQAEVERVINRSLNEMPYCLGINNHMGSLATSDQRCMGFVMEALRKRGKAFLDSRTSNVSVAYQTAQKERITTYRNDLFLDSPDISNATMERKIQQILNLGASSREVVAITHCHSSQKLAYLKTFIARIRAEGYTLIPLSRVGKYDVPLIL